MTSVSDFLEFTTQEGNKSYVRKESIAAIYHDGTSTRICLSDVSFGSMDSYDSQGLVASEMPKDLFERLAAGPASPRPARGVRSAIA